MSEVSYNIETGASGTIVQWTNLAPGDQGKPYLARAQRSNSVQVEGKFNGNSLMIEGTLTGKTYSVLKNSQGNPLIFYTEGIEDVGVETKYIRPIFYGGQEGSVTVTLLII